MVKRAGRRSSQWDAGSCLRTPRLLMLPARNRIAFGRPSRFPADVGTIIKPTKLWRRRADVLVALGCAMVHRRGRFPKSREETEQLCPFRQPRLLSFVPRGQDRAILYAAVLPWGVQHGRWSMANRDRDVGRERFWRTMLERQAGSGLSVREFCRREQLAESDFYAWRQTITERDQQQDAINQRDRRKLGARPKQRGIACPFRSNVAGPPNGNGKRRSETERQSRRPYTHPFGVFLVLFHRQYRTRPCLILSS